MRYENDSSVDYLDKVVNNGEETVAAIRTIDDIHDLFIVGRGQGQGRLRLFGDPVKLLKIGPNRRKNAKKNQKDCHRLENLF
jgi:hypothetical protein